MTIKELKNQVMSYFENKFEIKDIHKNTIQRNEKTYVPNYITTNYKECIKFIHNLKDRNDIHNSFFYIKENDNSISVTEYKSKKITYFSRTKLNFLNKTYTKKISNFTFYENKILRNGKALNLSEIIKHAMNDNFFNLKLAKLIYNIDEDIDLTNNVNNVLLLDDVRNITKEEFYKKFNYNGLDIPASLIKAMYLYEDKLLIDKTMYSCIYHFNEKYTEVEKFKNSNKGLGYIAGFENSFKSHYNNLYNILQDGTFHIMSASHKYDIRPPKFSERTSTLRKFMDYEFYYGNDDFIKNSLKSEDDELFKLGEQLVSNKYEIEYDNEVVEKTDISKPVKW